MRNGVIIGVALGLTFGLVMGLATGDVVLWLVIGVAVGTSFGAGGQALWAVNRPRSARDASDSNLRREEFNRRAVDGESDRSESDD